jgi:CheY-like chemotaxis protein
MVLTELGYNVLSAEHGVHALQLIHDNHDQRIDLLLTDIIMPQMGGRELAERMRQNNPTLKVLFITGYSSEADGISRMLSPITFYLSKPFTPTAIGRKVREVLDEPAV